MNFYELKSRCKLRDTALSWIREQDIHISLHYCSTPFFLKTYCNKKNCPLLYHRKSIQDKKPIGLIIHEKK